MPLPFCLASTPTASVTWQALQTSSASAAAASASLLRRADNQQGAVDVVADLVGHGAEEEAAGAGHPLVPDDQQVVVAFVGHLDEGRRSEEHTSELQSRQYLVCRLLLEKKNKYKRATDMMTRT